MSVFFDTNVVLEYLLDRRNSDVVEQVLSYLKRVNSLKYLSSGSFSTLAYLLEVEFKRRGFEGDARLEQLRGALNVLLSEYVIVGDLDWKKGVGDIRFSDLEDSFQFQAALSAGCSVLLTFNVHDFKHVLSSHSLSVLTPAEYLSLYCNK